MTLPVRIEQMKYDYRRGSIDTQLRHTYSFFEPNVRYRIDHNSNHGKSSLERHITLN